MERSPSTNTSSSATHDTELALRLQTLLTSWHSTPRGQNITELHSECLRLAGTQSPLLPYRLAQAPQLNLATLRQVAKRHHLEPVFPIMPAGVFDSALIAYGQERRFLLVLRQDMSLRDQVALYAHAVAHLLRDDYMHQAGRHQHLNSERNATHLDRLEELRYTETAPDLLDRDVLEGLPALASLVEAPIETKATQNRETQELRKRLKERGWDKYLVDMLYDYTEGRVLPGTSKRGRKRNIDALLRLSSSLPVAVVYQQRQGQSQGQALSYLKEAAQRLAVPFAYLFDTRGNIEEWSWLEGQHATPRYMPITEFPTREQLRERWYQALQLDLDRDLKALEYPYRIIKKEPRYYQEVAINNALIAVLQARRGLREKRILITMATGTGKTMVAFQLLWKLKQSGAIRKALFLADRKYLLDQARLGEFAPFKDGIAQGKGDINTSREIIFGSYQWLANADEFTVTRYQDYPPDFFDVIIVDECHRGSAHDNSQWRQILQYFSSAIQIGLTATPLNSSNVQTQKYFGNAIYTYSLSRGISDGFLAPYRVRRVLLGQANIPRQLSTHESKPQYELGEEIVMETSKAMRSYTQTIAEHLANYLQASDPRAKTIIFCVDSAHANQMRQALQEACAAWTRPGDIVRIVNEDGTVGTDNLDKFCNVEETQPFLVTTAQLLSTGVDVPTCKNIVLARGVGSMVEFKQIIGRGTRLFEPEKNTFTILDYAGAIKHFYEPNFDGAPDVLASEQLTPTGEAQPGESPETGASTEEMPATPTGEATEAQPGPSDPEPEAPGYAGEPESTEDISVGSVESEDTPPGNSPQQPAGGPPTQGQAPTWEQEGEPEAEGPVCETAHHNDCGQESPHARQEGRPAIVKEGEPVEPPMPTPPPGAGTQQVHDDGRKIIVWGEFAYELGPDGKTLRQGTVHQFAVQALSELVTTPEILRQQWSETDTRLEIIEHLEANLVSLENLAKELQLQECDALDVLLHAAFQQKPLSRQQRVERLVQTHRDFFARFEQDQLAREVLRAILEKYVNGEAPNIADTKLIYVAPISNMARPGEIAQAFKACGMTLRDTLQQLQRLLYSV